MRIERLYFKSYTIISQIWMCCVPFIFFALSLKSFISGDYYVGIACLLIGLVWLPYSLIATDIFRYKNMGSRVVDLACYEFGADTFDLDFNITDEEAKLIEKLFTEKTNADPTNHKYLKIARDIAIAENFDTRMYFALLHRAVLAIGGVRSGESMNSSLKDKLSILKKKIEKMPKVERPAQTKPNDEPKGKYDFL